MEKLNKSELILLSSFIKRLNDELPLESRTDSDVRLAINELLYQRAYNRYYVNGELVNEEDLQKSNENSKEDLPF